MKRLPSRLLLLFSIILLVFLLLLFERKQSHFSNSLIKPEYSMLFRINRPIVAIRKDWFNIFPNMVYDSDYNDSIINPGYRLLSGSEKIKEVSTLIKTDNDYYWFRLPPNYSLFHLFFVEYGLITKGSIQADSIMTARYLACLEPELSLKRLFVKHTSSLPDTVFFCGMTDETPHYCLHNKSFYLTPRQCYNKKYRDNHYPILEIKDYVIDSSVNFYVADTNGTRFFRNYKMSVSDYYLQLCLNNDHLYIGSLERHTK